MLRKILLVGGLAGIGYSFYYYFKNQLNLALDLNYKLKDFRIVELTTSEARIKTQIEVRNKSSFNLTIESYDVRFNYQKHEVAKTSSNIPIVIGSDRTFILEAEGVIDLRKVTSALFPFVMDVTKKKPINLTLHGFINVNFLNLNHVIELDGRQVTTSNNLLAEIGLEKPFDKTRNKLDDLLGKIGIKI